MPRFVETRVPLVSGVRGWISAGPLDLVAWIVWSGSPARRGDVPIVWRTPYGRNCRSPGGSSTTSCPDAAVRVVSPHGLRYRMAYDADLLSPVMRIFSRVVFQSLRKRASEFGIPRGQCGAVTFVQRFGSALNLHPHGHRVFAADLEH